MLQNVILLEFPEEAESLKKYLLSNDLIAEKTIVIGLNPSVRLVFSREGRSLKDTLQYFTSEAHNLTLQKSEEICAWLWRHVHLVDSEAVEFPYTQSFIWYVRLFIHELLWEIELIHRAVDMHSPTHIIVGQPALDNSSDQQLHPHERYLGELARRFASNSSLKVSYLSSESRRPRLNSMIEKVAKKAFCLCVAPILGLVHRGKLVRRYDGNCILGTTDQYRMDNVVYDFRQSNATQPALVMREWPRWTKLSSLITKQDCHPFNDEVYLGFWETGVKEDQESRRHLEEAVDGVMHQILAAPDIFSYRGVVFSDLVAKKVESGIKSFILSLHKRAATIRTLLTSLNPSAVVSVGNRNDDLLMGVMCQQVGIPAMMISHGSHVAQKNDAGREEWYEQAHRLIGAPFPFVGLQSKLAEEFLETLPSESVPVRTGPVLWGLRGTRAECDRISKNPETASGFVVMHAGTPKRRGGRRFYVYETLDEYVESVVHVARATLQIPYVHFVIKFRPAPGLSLEDLRAMLPDSDRISINIDEPLIDVLQRSHLLISFSSTTIEEGLQHGVPVLLYGGNGRYHHIPNPMVLSGSSSGQLAPVYAVEEDEFLADTIKQILHQHNEENGMSSIFDQFRFSEQEIVSLPDWLRSAKKSVVREPLLALGVS